MRFLCFVLAKKPVVKYLPPHINFNCIPYIQEARENTEDVKIREREREREIKYRYFRDKKAYWIKIEVDQISKKKRLVTWKTTI